MAVRKRETISHARICEQICDVLKIEYFSRQTAGEVKFDCLAKGDEGSIILEGESLSNGAAVSNLHVEGHLSRILGMLTEGKPIMRVIWIVGEEKKKNRLKGIIVEWKKNMEKLLEPYASKFPKMVFCILNYDLIKRMHKGTASIGEIKKMINKVNIGELYPV